MTDLDNQLALAVDLMKRNRRCGAIYKLDTVNQAFVCTRMANHVGGHDYEDVTSTIPLNWRSNSDA